MINVAPNSWGEDSEHARAKIVFSVGWARGRSTESQIKGRSRAEDECNGWTNGGWIDGWVDEWKNGKNQLGG